MSSYISCKMNGVDLLRTFQRLKKYEIIEASTTELFTSFPHFSKVKDIEVGCDGTMRSILILNNGNFLVVEGI